MSLLIVVNLAESNTSIMNKTPQTTNPLHPDDCAEGQSWQHIQSQEKAAGVFYFQFFLQDVTGEQWGRELAVCFACPCANMKSSVFLPTINLTLTQQSTLFMMPGFIFCCAGTFSGYPACGLSHTILPTGKATNSLLTRMIVKFFFWHRHSCECRRVTSELRQHETHNFSTILLYSNCLQWWHLAHFKILVSSHFRPCRSN